MKTISRIYLLRWVGWFFFANVILYFLITLNYWPLLPGYDAAPMISFKGFVVSRVFVLLAFIGQCGLFALIGYFLSAFITLCFGKKWLSISVSVITAGIIAWLLVVDSIIYHLYYFHLAGVVWHILRSGVAEQVLELSNSEITVAILAVLLFILLELFIAWGVWHWMQRDKQRLRGWFMPLILAACLLVSYTLYVDAGAITKGVSAQELSNDHLIVMEAKIVPYYLYGLSRFIPGANSMGRLMNYNEGFFAQNKQRTRPLRYPLSPLKVQSPKKHLNIVIIAIDTWRADMMNEKVTPHITQFAKQSWQFTKHYSGGNATRPGIFSLFYSIPVTYWASVLQQKRDPLFIDQLLAQHYQLGIFASATLAFPALDKTVFRGVANLTINTAGDTPAARDRKITAKFKQFIEAHQHKTFFSFLFYDAVHGYCESDQSFAHPFQPKVGACDRAELTQNTDPIPYLNRYKNAVYFDDGLIGKDLALLKQKHLLKNTIVIITADHGEEFNDEHLGYWGHASAYDPYQVHVPFILYWPGKKPKVINHMTSHYDVVPTLMQKVLGVKNPIQDYSIGHLLSDKASRYPLIIGSYVDFAYLTKNRITTIYPGGDYAIAFANGHNNPQGKLNASVLHQVMLILKRYFMK